VPGQTLPTDAGHPARSVARYRPDASAACSTSDARASRWSRQEESAHELGRWLFCAWGCKRRALQASPPSDAATCWAGKHRHASHMSTPRMRRCPTAFSEIQTHEQFEILLIPRTRPAQCSFALGVAGRRRGRVRLDHGWLLPPRGTRAYARAPPVSATRRCATMRQRGWQWPRLRRHRRQSLSTDCRGHSDRSP